MSRNRISGLSRSEAQEARLDTLTALGEIEIDEGGSDDESTRHGPRPERFHRLRRRV